MKDREKALGRALDGKERAAVEVDALMAVSDKVSRAVKVEVPDAERERAIFVRAIGARRRSLLRQAFVPAMSAAGALVLVLLYAGFFAEPGSALYSVRQALDDAGITQSSSKEIDATLLSAERDLASANAILEVDEKEAVRLAISAIEKVGQARSLLADFKDSDHEELVAQADLLEDKALSLIQYTARSEDRERADDNSGPGGGDGDDDDNSGPGSGDGDDDDNSGPGSGDGDDDRSGSGGGDDENSGPGGDDDDNSGPGSGDGSGGSGGDNSGPGSDD